MGINNRKRRAAKQRKQDRQQRANAESRSQARGSRAPGNEGGADEAAFALVELRVTAAVRRLARGKIDDTDLLARTESLLRTAWPHPREVVEVVLADLVSQLAQEVRQGGWGSADLQQLVLRNAGERHLPVLRTALEDPARLRFGTLELLSSGLAVAARLCTAPLLAGEVAADPAKAAHDEHPKLAQARALLAKAESTEYDEEAESLTSKAQELISRYALGRLVEGSNDHQVSVPIVRRIWLDAPYTRAKASLVHAVLPPTGARPRAPMRSASPSWSVPAPTLTRLSYWSRPCWSRRTRRCCDTAVPSIATGGHAPVRSGSRSCWPTPLGLENGFGKRPARPRSPWSRGRRLPVLQDHAGRVSAAFEAMVPHTVARSTKIGSHDGWRAGLAAAELALLDVNGKLTERTG